MSNPETSIQLIERVRAGEKQALADLYDAYSGMVYGLVLRMVYSEPIAQEIVQDVFLKVWNNIKSYDATKSRISTWIMNIARNRAIDEIRSKRFKNDRENQSIENSVQQIEALGGSEIKTDSIGLKSVMRRLRPEQQKLIELVYFGGFTHEEAAKELSIPLGTVKTRIRSSIQELRKQLRVEQ